MSELSVWKTPETKRMESFPLKSSQNFIDKSEWKTARIYAFVYRNGITTGSQKRNSRFLAEKERGLAQRLEMS